MVYHTFVSGEVLTAANVMNDLMNQSVIVCTSGTRPASPVAGMTIFETDTLNTVQYNGSAWVTTASIGAWSSVTLTLSNITSGNYTMTAAQLIMGKTCFLTFHATITNTSTGTVTLGGLTAYAHGTRQLGSAMIQHSGTWAFSAVNGNGSAGGTTAVFPLESGTIATTGYWGNATAFASGDGIDGFLVYEIA